MKKTKLLMPILGLTALSSALMPLVSCGKNEAESYEESNEVDPADSATIEIIQNKKGQDLIYKVTFATGKTFDYNGSYVTIGGVHAIAGEQFKTNATDNTVTVFHKYITGKVIFHLATTDDVPAGKCQIVFEARIGGIITGSPTLLVDEGIVWQNVEKPQYQADSGYTFAGWYNGDNMMLGDEIINENTTITLKFEQTTPASDFTFTQDGSVATITGYSGNSANLVIPSTYTEGAKTYPVEIIGESAFKDKTTITSIVFSENIKKIGQYAFQGCKGITTLSIPDNVEEIGDEAFQGCSSLAVVTIGNGITDEGWDNSIFSGCADNGKLVISKIGGWGQKPFGGCEFTDFTITGGTVPNQCFKEMEVSSLKVALTEGVTKIGQGVFINMYTLPKSFHIPSTVNMIDKGAFYSCSIEELTYPGTKEDWGKIDFNDQWTLGSQLFVVHCSDGDITITPSL